MPFLRECPAGEAIGCSIRVRNLSPQGQGEKAYRYVPLLAQLRSSSLAAGRVSILTADWGCRAWCGVFSLLSFRRLLVHTIFPCVVALAWRGVAWRGVAFTLEISLSRARAALLFTLAFFSFLLSTPLDSTLRVFSRRVFFFSLIARRPAMAADASLRFQLVAVCPEKRS